MRLIVAVGVIVREDVAVGVLVFVAVGVFDDVGCAVSVRVGVCSCGAVGVLVNIIPLPARQPFKVAQLEKRTVYTTTSPVRAPLDKSPPHNLCHPGIMVYRILEELVILLSDNSCPHLCP